MRSFLVAFIMGLVLLAQSQVNQCGETCIQNMLQNAPSLGCSVGDATCLCENVNFGNGLRDCATEACGTAELTSVISYGESYCAAVLSTAAGTQSTTASPASTTESVISTTKPNIGSTTSLSTTSTNVYISTSAHPSSSTGVSQSISSNAAVSSIAPGTPSSVTSATQGSFNDGLMTGAKAGIGAGVAIFTILALLLILFFFTKRKKQRKQNDTQDLETVEGLAAQRGHEMITSANTHEMDAKQLEIYQTRHLGPDIVQAPHKIKAQNSWPGDPESLGGPEGAAELDASNVGQSTNLRSNGDPHQPSELDALTAPARETESHSSPIASIPTTGQQAYPTIPVTNKALNEELEPTLAEKSAQLRQAESGSATEDSGDRVEALRKRMERVREDKERLQKIQALKELEDELQAELLMEQKKAAGI